MRKLIICFLMTYGLFAEEKVVLPAQPIISDLSRAKFWRSMWEISEALIKKTQAECEMYKQCGEKKVIIDSKGEPQCGEVKEKSKTE